MGAALKACGRICWNEGHSQALSSTAPLQGQTQTSSSTAPTGSNCGEFANDCLEASPDQGGYNDSAAEDKVIFLDVDGVLHGMNDDDFFNPQCMQTLSEIVAATGRPRVVLHSSWKDEKQQIRDMLTAALSQVGVELFDTTHKQPSPYWVRADDILAYLKEHPHIKHFVILDDMDTPRVDWEDSCSDMLNRHHVQPDGQNGLRPENIDEVVAVMSLDRAPQLPEPRLTAENA